MKKTQKKQTELAPPTAEERERSAYEREQHRKSILIHPDHPKPVTRRDFLANGTIAMSGMVMMPSILSLIAAESNARAAVSQPCPAGPSGALPAFLVFDMGGGGSLAGNWVPLGKDNLPLGAGAYKVVGISETTPTLNTTFGAPMATNSSKILEGILSVIGQTPGAIAATKISAIANRSQDDTNINRLSAIQHVAKIGSQGEIVTGPLGMSNSNSGGNSATPIFDVTLKPLAVTRADSVANALSFGAGLQGLSNQQLATLVRTTRNLTSTQVQRLNGMTYADQFQYLSECGYLKNETYAGGVSGINPTQDPQFSALFNLGTAPAPTLSSVDARYAAIIMNVLKGTSGPGVISFGGCDYHDNTRTSGDRIDLNVGVQIGRAILAAFNLKRKLVFQIITDGGVVSSDGVVWTSDSNGQRTFTLVGVVDPTGQTQQLQENGMAKQLGYYTTATAVAGDSILGTDATMAAYATFANYLSVAGRLSDFSKLVSTVAVPTANIDKLLLFKA